MTVNCWCVWGPSYHRHGERHVEVGLCKGFLALMTIMTVLYGLILDRPCTFTLAAPSGMSETSNLSILCAQKAASRGRFSPFSLGGGLSSVMVCLLFWEAGLLHRVCRPHGFLLGVVGTDGIIEARDLEDALVVIAEPVGQQLLLLAIDADKQRDKQPYAATVHVLEVLEVQDDRACLPVAGLVVGVHQDVLGEGGELSMHIDDADLLARFADVHLHLGFGHVLPPRSVYLLYLLVLAA